MTHFCWQLNMSFIITRLNFHSIQVFTVSSNLVYFSVGIYIIIDANTFCFISNLQSKRFWKCNIIIAADTTASIHIQTWHEVFSNVPPSIPPNFWNFSTNLRKSNTINVSMNQVICKFLHWRNPLTPKNFSRDSIKNLKQKNTHHLVLDIILHISQAKKTIDFCKAWQLHNEVKVLYLISALSSALSHRDMHPRQKQTSFTSFFYFHALDVAS